MINFRRVLGLVLEGRSYSEIVEIVEVAGCSRRDVSRVKKVIEERGLTAATEVSEEDLGDWFPDGRRMVSAEYDASAALSGLLNTGPARESLASEQLHAPHLVDSEVASGLRRHVASGRIAADDGWAALDAWRRLGLTRYATHGLLERIWALRDNLSAYDAGYVALAESLGCSLITADARISRAPGIRCPITVVPR